MLIGLETERLRLYPPNIADLEARLAMDRDPDVMRFLLRPIPEDVDWHRADVREKILAPENPASAFWHIEEKGAPGFIGCCGLFPLEDSGMIELGYRFVRRVWGRGLATDAAAAALDHGFRHLKLAQIVAVTAPRNLASQRVLQKIGLSSAGVFCHYGQDVAVFVCLRADYFAAQPGVT